MVCSALACLCVVHRHRVTAVEANAVNKLLPLVRPPSVEPPSTPHRPSNAPATPTSALMSPSSASLPSGASGASGGGPAVVEAASGEGSAEAKAALAELREAALRVLAVVCMEEPSQKQVRGAVKRRDAAMPPSSRPPPFKPAREPNSTSSLLAPLSSAT